MSAQGQRGLTLIGFLFVVLVIGLVAYTGLRIVPMYLQYSKVVSSLEAVRNQLEEEGGRTSAREIRNMLSKRFDVNYINHLDVDDVEIKRDREKVVIRAAYEARVPLFYNLFVVGDFDKTVEVGR